MSKGDQPNIAVAGSRAFIYRSGAREDLILQVGFSGTASSFAWILPVPGKPLLRSVDPVIFDELRTIFDPRILPPGQPEGIVERPSNILLPKPVTAQQINVIAPTSARAITQWLADNNYDVPAEAGPIFADYISRGWYFITVKVLADRTRSPQWLQPLWITLNSQRASLPLRLSSLNKVMIPLQVYVAADSIVKAPGFTEASTISAPLRTKYKEGEIPNFFNIVTRECQLTDLRVLLDPKSIKSDIVILPK